MSDAIVSVAFKGRENYPAGLPRMMASARAAGFTGDFVTWPSGPEDTVTTDSALKAGHAASPYGFKPEIIAQARAAGHQRVLWCDSTMWVARDAPAIFEKIGRLGLLIFDNPGCTEDVWTADDCLAAMGCTPEQAQRVDQVMACCVGFDFGWSGINELFDKWLAFSRDGVSFLGKSGSSRPRFQAHRHDQSVLTWLAHLHGVPHMPYGEWLAYWNDRHKFSPPLFNRGLGA